MKNRHENLDKIMERTRSNFNNVGKLTIRSVKVNKATASSYINILIH